MSVSAAYGAGSSNFTAVEAAFVKQEALTDFPIVEWIDATQPAAAGGDIELNGSGLLQGCTFDSLVLDEDTGELDVFALKPGDSGITVEVVAGAGALGVAFNTTTLKLTITLASGGSTDDAIATAINADAAQCNGYVRANSSAAGSLTGNQSVAPMTGGTGSYAGCKVYLSGVECLPINETGTTSTAKWSATKIEVTVPDLTGESDARAATDVALLRVMVDGTHAPPISCVLG